LKTDSFNASTKVDGVSVCVFSLSVKLSVCAHEDSLTPKALTCLIFGGVRSLLAVNQQLNGY